MDLKDKVLEAVKGTKLASVATITEESNRKFPAVRYMWTTAYDDLTLSAFTKADSRKVSQIEKNPNAALMIASGTPAKPYVSIRANAEILKEPELKRRYWGPHQQEFIKNPDDPGYVAIRFVPTRIEYYSGGKMEVLQL